MNKNAILRCAANQAGGVEQKTAGQALFSLYQALLQAQSGRCNPLALCSAIARTELLLRQLRLFYGLSEGQIDEYKRQALLALEKSLAKKKKPQIGIYSKKSK